MRWLPLIALLACKCGKDTSDSGQAAPLASVPDAPAEAAAPPPLIPRFLVVEGEAPNGSWVPGYEVGRFVGDTDKDYLQAGAHCRSNGLVLCTETQWLKACATNAELGKQESWTASWDAEQVIVRGGESCDSRRTVAGSDHSSSRIGLCCTRAIAIRSSNRTIAFLRSSQAHQLRLEVADNASDASALEKEWYESVAYDGKRMTREEARAAQQRWFEANRGHSLIYDTCDVQLGAVATGLGKQGTSPGLVHDCIAVLTTHGQVSVTRQRIGRYQAEDSAKPLIVEVEHHTRTRKLGPL
jgi:hypothetical protein